MGLRKEVNKGRKEKEKWVRGGRGVKRKKSKGKEERIKRSWGLGVIRKNEDKEEIKEEKRKKREEEQERKEEKDGEKNL